MIQSIKRLYNKIRIKILEIFTGRVKRIVLTDHEGKEHEVVVEQNKEKVCDHKTIREIAPTMWKCTGCDDVYFQIGYKVMLTRQDLLSYLTDIADHLKSDVLEDKEPE